MGSSKESAPATVTPEQSAQAQMQAQINSVLPLQQAQMSAWQDPTSGLMAQNDLWNQIRQQLYPEQYGVQQQYTQNILGQLQSPTGITPEQQMALDARRSQAQYELQRALNTQSNLGNKLYGGIAFDRVADATQNLQNQFAEQDITRDTQNRQMAYQNALPILQAYLGQQIQQPNVGYTNAAPSADQASSSMTTQRNADLQYALQQQANQNALYSALYGGLGQAAGGWMGGDAFNNMLS